MTVRGPVPASALGITLMHEHVFVDARAAVSDPDDAEARELRRAPVRVEDLALLREYPYASIDNCYLSDPRVAAHELMDFVRRGGSTVVDPTCWNMGRDPEKLYRVAEETGLHMVMGTGLYIERSHPDWSHRLDEEAIAARIIRECRDGLETTGGPLVRPGLIGEIGVSDAFTPAEQRSLRAAALGQLETGLPLMVHLPGWQRRGHEVLDICEALEVDPRTVVLAHMDGSIGDPAYQLSLARRGAHLEFDAIGMSLSFPGQGEAPSDSAIAAAVLRLVNTGFADRVLLSHDVFLKVQLRTFGGNGYGHLLRSFLRRLERAGLDAAICRSLVIDNPRRVFEEAGAAA